MSISKSIELDTPLVKGTPIYDTNGELESILDEAFEFERSGSPFVEKYKGALEFLENSDLFIVAPEPRRKTLNLSSFFSNSKASTMNTMSISTLSKADSENTTFSSKLLKEGSKTVQTMSSIGKDSSNNSPAENFLPLSLGKSSLLTRRKLTSQSTI